MATYERTLDVCGDTLAITWTGSAWVSPVNGQQHSAAESAMRVELEHYLSACGDDIDDPAVAEQIEGWLSQMED